MARRRDKTNMADRKKKPPKTPKTRSRRGFFDLVNALLTLFVVAVIVAGGLILYGVHSFYAPGPIKADTDFVVEKGANFDTDTTQSLVDAVQKALDDKAAAGEGSK